MTAPRLLNNALDCSTCRGFGATTHRPTTFHPTNILSYSRHCQIVTLGSPGKNSLYLGIINRRLYQRPNEQEPYPRI